MAEKGSSKYTSRVRLENDSIVYFDEWDRDLAHRIRVYCGRCGSSRLLTYAGAVDVARGRVSGCCRRCESSTHATRMLGNGNSYWRGGVRENFFGYTELRVSGLSDSDKALAESMATKDGSVLEHRLVMARKVGRPLTANELVHHLNGVKNDNRLENLLVVTHSTHCQVAFDERDNEIIRLRAILDRNKIEY